MIKTNDSLVISYLSLRTSVGIIGMALPFVLVAGKILLDSPGILGSISSYYHSIMGDVFVGSLCAIGIFLLSYRGYERRDDLAGDLACVFALGTAFFPTVSSASAIGIEALVGKMHFFFAACLFLTLAFFALVLFRKTNPSKPMTPRKRLRNLIYSICGFGILLCLVLIVVVKVLPIGVSLEHLSPVFWLESIALLFFGISWFVKGEAILKDEDEHVPA